MASDALRLKIVRMKATNTNKSEAKVESTRSESKSVVHLALDVADRSQHTAVAVLQDARMELRSAIDNGLELAEKLAAGTLRFARKLVQKLDDAGNDALVGAEHAIATAVQTARVSRNAGELAQSSQAA
jgi:hypothetical protein